MAANMKQPLLPRKSSTAGGGGDTSTSHHHRPPLYHGLDFLGLKKRGHGLRSWIRVDAAGNSQIVDLDKFTIMRRCDLPARDLRLLDPLFVYPSTVLGRERAIVVNLEQIRCIISADEVLLLNSLDNYVLQYVVELQRRLPVGEVERGRAAGFEGGAGYPPQPASVAEYLPFEFRALEVALEAACSFLDTQVSWEKLGFFI